MNNVLRNIVESAFADVEDRLRRLPPGFQPQGGKAEYIPAFFDGMLQFEADDLPYPLPQYIAAFSAVPLVVFDRSNKGSYRSDQMFAYEDRPGFSGASVYYSRHSFQDGPYFYLHNGFNWRGYRNLESSPMPEIRRAYNELLNRRRLNQIPAPDKFNSLQLYTFFAPTATIGRGVSDGMIALMKRVGQKADGLDASARTREEIVKILCQETGLSADSASVAGLIDRWGLCPRIGLFANENDRELVQVLYEVLEKIPRSLDEYYFNSAIDRACHEKGVPGIKTVGSVPYVMRRILGNYYGELIESIRNGAHEADRPRFGKLEPIDPDKINPVSTLNADLRQIIEEETLGTGARDASSLNHSALFLHPKAPLPSIKIKPRGSKRQP